MVRTYTMCIDKFDKKKKKTHATYNVRHKRMAMHITGFENS